MRKDKLKVGKTYRDGKGNARKIHRLLPMDDYSWAVLVEYLVIEGRKSRAPDKVGPNGEELFTCLITPFQRWAKTHD